MVVGVITVELQVPGSQSLKDKRQVIRALVALLRREFNVAVAEVDHLESWQRAMLGLACVSADRGHAQQQAQNVAEYIEDHAVDYYVLDVDIELL
ncbi:MAG: DUF503 domain-containing protein [Anaerolineae bacterium]|jgi:uncharacterized protein YlxP (DUF503 family)|nr:DUF503 domain-containing protein [Chloroflexota bacterium]